MVEVAQSVSQILSLQHLLEQTDVVELFEGFSETEWGEEEQTSENNTKSQQESDCQVDLNQYVSFFCGSSRKTISRVLKSILERSCNGDSYKRGWYYCSHHLYYYNNYDNVVISS